MTNREEFDVWWGGNSISINNEYEKDTAFEAWEARGKLDAKRIAELEALAEQPKEWQGLSDDEINEAVKYLNVKIDYPIMFARLIEMHLKEKNS
jgi:hypothetical protein